MAAGCHRSFCISNHGGLRHGDDARGHHWRLAGVAEENAERSTLVSVADHPVWSTRVCGDRDWLDGDRTRAPTVDYAWNHAHSRRRHAHAKINCAVPIVHRTLLLSGFHSCVSIEAESARKPANSCGFGKECAMIIL